MAQPLILVIEDNPSDVYILRSALLEIEEESNVRIASDGEQALQFLYSLREQPRHLHPCVIVLDLHLPKHDGLEILQFLRREPALAHVQVVVITGAASPREEAQLQALGAGYRTKPASLDEFDELAAQLIAICKSSQILA